MNEDMLKRLWYVYIQMGADGATAAVRAARDESRWRQIEGRERKKRQREETTRRRQEFVRAFARPERSQDPPG